MIHAHHSINFGSIQAIDWHLRNLWEGGYKCIKPMPMLRHRKLHREKGKPVLFYTRSNYSVLRVSRTCEIFIPIERKNHGNEN